MLNNIIVAHNRAVDSNLRLSIIGLTKCHLLMHELEQLLIALTAGIDFANNFSLVQYPYVLLSAGIIALLTFAICFSGVKLGQTFGTKLADKAGYLGGGVLIFLGLKILVTDIIFI